MRLELLTADVQTLFPFLETVLQDGGKKNYSIEGIVKTFHNNSGYSGFDYEEETFEGKLSLGMILGGTGYVLRRSLRNVERFDYFNLKGEHTFSADQEALQVLIVDNYNMDLLCPICNHLYNFLSYEYKQAAEGKSSTGLVHSVETFLRGIYKSKSVRLPIKDGANDPAINNIYKRILKTEMDPVLTWEERQLVFANYRETLKTVVDTKARAHKMSKAKLKAGLVRKDRSNFIARFLARPQDNAQGILYKYTVGKIIWFFDTVKNNLGYSVALAVYGPFTYYFITMPMNPHAMQAVGRVRTAYIDVRDTVNKVWSHDASVVMQDLSTQKANAATASIPTTTVDTVSTQNAAPVVPLKANDSAIMANIIFPSAITTQDAAPMSVDLGDGKRENYKANFMNMLVSTDVPKVDAQTWGERMSNFKQLQIAYEENIDYASRMGRLEQLETQYNFPMQVESTWEELERYNALIYKLRTENPNLSAKMKQYLFNETNRTQQLELYLWDRLSRFILDQPYVMLDEAKEQKRSDYYVGRSFVFLQEMTNVLSWRYKNFKKPEGFEKIQKLAEFYTGARKEHGTVLKNLEANSDLFKQKNVYDTKEFRSYMKRQWEILFLQNSKAEEAGNMGLNMYIWSTRNTVWVLQSIFSAKREELALLVKRDVSGLLFTPEEMLARSKTSMQFETLLHNLTLEYVGIREEIMNRLGKDIESTQRMIVIDNLKEFLTDRDKLDGLNVADSKKTAGNTL
jgi:hypothetical protein